MSAAFWAKWLFWNLDCAQICCAVRATCLVGSNRWMKSFFTGTAFVASKGTSWQAVWWHGSHRFRLHQNLPPKAPTTDPAPRTTALKCLKDPKMHSIQQIHRCPGYLFILFHSCLVSPFLLKYDVQTNLIRRLSFGMSNVWALKQWDIFKFRMVSTHTHIHTENQ